ncbi:hypothetical protein [Novilysobacter arseniciresistens]|uniref:hypothetical protein n=1 Tax=Novilysobacter arseniciresistens TaxID=1385522 RepID=UPI000A3FF75D|nr:hypothetical protein [Lysobacter arseniciresistens]
MVRLSAIPVLLLLVLSAPAALPASAQVNTCQQADGTAVYTDRGCASIGAMAAAARVPSLTGNRRAYRGGCARNLQDLMFEMSTAIDARDANRLANVYHWAGMSGRSGYSVMDRLDTVVRRPLVDIVPVMPARPDPWATAQLASAVLPAAAAVATRATATPTPAGPAAEAAAVLVETLGDVAPVPMPASLPAPASEPVALRVVQTLEDGVTPSETVFDLHQHFGCVWIKG